MARIPAEIKRGLLQFLADQAQDSGITLLAALKAYSKARFEEIQSGRFVVSTSGNGSSVSFYTAPVGMPLQPDQFAAVAQEFREVFTTALATLQTAGTANPTDAQLLSTMLADDRLQTVTEARLDVTLMRWYGGSR